MSLQAYNLDDNLKQYELVSSAKTGSTLGQTPAAFYSATRAGV